MSTSETSESKSFKIIVAGEHKVGKTSFVNNLTNKQFVEDYQPKINAINGADVSIIQYVYTNTHTYTHTNDNTNSNDDIPESPKTAHISHISHTIKATKDTTQTESQPSNKVIFDIWDCASSKDFAVLTDAYFVNADAAIVMFDVENESTMIRTKDWIDRIQRVCENIPILLVGNKLDIQNLRKNMHCGFYYVTNYCAKTGHSFIKTSAKTGHNCEKVMLKLSRILLNDPSVEFERKYLTADHLCVHKTNDQLLFDSKPTIKVTQEKQQKESNSSRPTVWKRMSDAIWSFLE